MRSRNHKRVVWALVASTLLHLLLLAAYVRMADWYRRQELRPTRYLPDLLLLAPDLFRQQPVARLPERLLEKAPAATPEAPSLPGVEVPVLAPVATDSLAPSASLADADDGEPGRRPLVFIASVDATDEPLAAGEVAAVGRLRDLVEGYQRIWLPRADTSSAAGRAQTRAEAIVARAFAAMGGLERLLKVTRIRRVVWIIADDTERLSGGRDDTPPYPYPIGVWQQHGLDDFERQAFRVDVDLSSTEPIPAYAFRNPFHAREAYYTNFDARWLVNAPLTTRQVRNRSEAARWHIVDRFLGEGVQLEYAGQGRFEAGPQRTRVVDKILVHDRKFGRELEAFFDADSGLLVADRESLLRSEAVWSQQKSARPAPVWTTYYQDYRPVDGLLLAHRWVRTMSPPPPRKPWLRRIDVRFNIAVNGAYPDTVAPQP